MDSLLNLRQASVRVLLAASLLLGGCASTGNVSLHAVREFADASAKLGGYAELSAPGLR